MNISKLNESIVALLGEGLDVNVLGVSTGEFGLRINGKEYSYAPVKSSGLTVYDLERKFKTIAKYSIGRALAWLKKNSILATGGKKR